MLRAMHSNVLPRGRSAAKEGDDGPPKARKSLQLLYQPAVRHIGHAV
jgi:hypothetical protein